MIHSEDLTSLQFMKCIHDELKPKEQEKGLAAGNVGNGGGGGDDGDVARHRRLPPLPPNRLPSSGGQ